MSYVIHKVVATPNRFYRTGEVTCFEISQATRDALVAGGATETTVSSAQLTTISSAAALAATKLTVGMDIANKTELTQAITAGVLLVTDHADELGYDIVLSNGVTGTATPDA